MNKSIILLLIATFLIHGMSLGDETRGLEIAQSVKAANSGWGNEEVRAVMTLKAANGREVIRRIRSRSIEIDGDGDKSLVIFDKPNEIKGTVFLTFSHKTGDDDQWMFLPALKRVKRISTSNRSGPFMGSEFAYEDISSEEIERYAYKYITTTKCDDGQDCFVYEKYPNDNNSGYSKQVVYVDTIFYRIHKIYYYDRKNDHLKTLTKTNYEQFENVWRARNWEMVNHLKNKSTSIVWRERKFKTGLTEKDFNKNALRRYK